MSASLDAAERSPDGATPRTNGAEGSLPTGEPGVSSGGYDPFIKFPWSRELGGSWSIGGMFSEQVGKLMALDDRQLAHSRHVLGHYGNVLSTTVVFVLDVLLGADGPVPRDWGDDRPWAGVRR